MSFQIFLSGQPVDYVGSLTGWTLEHVDSIFISNAPMPMSGRS
jgi:hypothetical protein